MFAKNKRWAPNVRGEEFQRVGRTKFIIENASSSLYLKNFDPDFQNFVFFIGISFTLKFLDIIQPWLTFLWITLVLVGLKMPLFIEVKASMIFLDIIAFLLFNDSRKVSRSIKWTSANKIVTLE